MSNKEKNISGSQQVQIAQISSLIRNWRINENLTQSDFGKLADVHFNSVYNIEHQRVSINTLLKCIRATGLKPSQFFELID